jgi:crossover junction endodeoxyribonuclease RuvC
MPVIVGIDPGVRPTVCVLIDDPGKPLAVEFHEGDETSYAIVSGKSKKHRPSAPLLRGILAGSLASLVVIEDVASRPGEGVASTFNFGFASGMAEGVAAGVQLPVLRVTPAVWKKAFRFPSGSSKAVSRHVAANLVPHLASYFTRAMDHNRADAFLMAYWARARVARS